MEPDKKYCVDCDSNFYNGNNEIGVKECWHFKNAKVMHGYCIGWWIPQDNKKNFMKTTTLSCHTEIGRFAYYDKLPKYLTRKVA